MSRLTCSSARLFAAYRVLLRLGTPRHPPYALRSLTIMSCGLRRISDSHAAEAAALYLSPFRYIVFRCLCLNPKMSVQTIAV